MPFKLIPLTILSFVALSASALADSNEEAEETTYEIAGDAGNGERIFRRCQACHQVGEDAQNGVGPNMNGIVGRAAGAFEDFTYSSALQEKADEGLVWTPEELDAFLTKPRDYLPGTKMSFAGLRRDTDREDVIAYLAGFEADGAAAE